MISIPPDDPASQGLHEGGPPRRGEEGGAGGRGEQEGQGGNHCLGGEEGGIKKSRVVVVDSYHCD